MRTPTPITIDYTEVEEEDPEEYWCHCGQHRYCQMIICEREGFTIPWTYTIPPPKRSTLPHAENLRSQRVNLKRA